MITFARALWTWRELFISVFRTRWPTGWTRWRRGRVDDPWCSRATFLTCLFGNSQATLYGTLSAAEVRPGG